MGDGQRYYDADDVRRAGRGAWVSILGAMGCRSELLTGNHGPCPGCGGRDRFRFDDKDGAGTFLCSQGTGEILAGDGIDLYAHCKGIEWKAAVNAIGEYLIPEKGRQWSGDRPSQAAPRRAVPPPPPQRQPQGVLSFDIEALRRFYRADLGIDFEWFLDRSPVDVSTIGSPEDFLETVYSPGERVLVFTNYYSQGQYIFEAGGRGAFRLADSPSVQAAKVEALPRDNQDGVWYLNQPVSGKWFPNPRGKADENGRLPLSRRSQESVTDWRFAILESDNAPDELWLNFLGQIPMPIAAIYTSGGRSVHALVRLEVHSKADFDFFRKVFIPFFSKLGADAGALTAVRLTRLPLCRRRVVTCRNCGKKTTAKNKAFKCKKCESWIRPEWAEWADQKLLYLNPRPDPTGTPIYQGGNKIVKI